MLAGVFQNVAWVRVRGKGSFQNSPQLRNFAERMISSDLPTIVVDLEDCPVMDSTFMGTLTGIAMRMQANPESRLQVINANQRNMQLLQSLGLDLILELDTTGTAWKEERTLVHENIDKPLTATEGDLPNHKDVVLEAHEALCQANEENVRRFRDVIEYLRKDLHSETN